MSILSASSKISDRCQINWKHHVSMGKPGENPNPKASQKYAYIDAMRGYAILLVIASHAFGSYALLPWPVKRFSNLAFLGVQLFFVVSAMTLSLSWFKRSASEVAPVKAFFIRRIFRIFPAYFLGFLLYLVVAPPGAAFSPVQMLATLTTLHGWSPGMLSTVSGSWAPVPGSWSIAAEFGFYMIFPLLLRYIHSWRSAIVAIALTTFMAFFLNNWAMWFYIDQYGFKATGQFIYYWLPNQLPVFASGLLGYFLLRRLKGSALETRISQHAGLIAGFGVLAFMSLAYLPVPRIPSAVSPFLSLPVLAALCFVVVVLASAHAHGAFWLAKPMARMGRVSFSAYLIHFAVIDVLEHRLRGSFALDSSGLRAIVFATLFYVATTLITFGLASISFAVVEAPMIALGGRLAAVVARGGGGADARDQQRTL